MGKFDFMPEDRRVPVVSSAFCSHDSSRAERWTPAIATTHCHVGLFDLAHPLPNAWLTAVLAQQRPCCSRGAARVVRSSGLIPLNILTTRIGFEGLKLQMQAASGICKGEHHDRLTQIVWAQLESVSELRPWLRRGVTSASNRCWQGSRRPSDKWDRHWVKSW